jgi:hypothetical protein
MMENRVAVLESENAELRRQVAELEAEAKEIGMAALLIGSSRGLSTFIPAAAIGEILAVLRHGDKKHPGEEWRRYDAKLHFDCGQGHCVDSLTLPAKRNVWYPNAREDESGRYHLAHAIVRLMFALSLVMEESD